MHRSRRVFLLEASAIVSTPAWGQIDAPRPVRLVVPLTAGSSIDIVARAVATKLQTLWGKPVVVENRTGAGGTLAAAYVAKSPPDGNTLFVSSNGHAYSPALYANLPYDIEKDFVNVAPVAKAGQVLVVGQPTGLASMPDLLAAARARPGELTYASAGVGTGTHFTAERFRIATGTDARHVPYRGGPEAMTDVAAGRVTFWFPSIAIAEPLIKAGRIVPLGVTTKTRSDILPKVPTIAELVAPDFDDALWMGISAPAGTPPALAAKLARDIASVADAPEVIEQFRKIAAEPMHMGQEEFGRFVRTETQAALRIAKAAGIQPQLQ